MAVRIRLRRVGRKGQPYYRVVVADSESPRDGRYLDEVGFYSPLSHPAELRMDLEKIEQWQAKGAGVTHTVASLIRKARRGGGRWVAYTPPAAAAASTAPATDAAEG